ncbi:hypothetical protein [Daejeonella oryzae]|uniref:hypothetical protein n=1 Tax=Daejeonella oryzae TaxID=1122943 RepID=UPI0004136AB8|nr:hypothetical protein [Daejeonella oryzae]
MKIKTAQLLLVISVICISCTNHDKSIVSTKNNLETLADKINPVSVKKDSLNNKQVESLINEIRGNFNQINKITKWDKIKKEFLERTNEGGEAKFFYLNSELKKIRTDQMGETFRLVREYYLDNSRLLFVFESFEQYHLPFDRSNSKYYESRKYFHNHKLFRRINSGKAENPLNEASVINDQKEILKELENLKILQQISL